MREMVYQAAAEHFSHNLHILSHFGKFLSEAEQKYAEAEKYLEQARQLEPHNEAVLHMLGKRFFDR
jgi:Tfp pilus assembly protein PilF